MDLLWIFPGPKWWLYMYLFLLNSNYLRCSYTVLFYKFLTYQYWKVLYRRTFQYWLGKNCCEKLLKLLCSLLSFHVHKTWNGLVRQWIVTKLSIKFIQSTCNWHSSNLLKVEWPNLHSMWICSMHIQLGCDQCKLFWLCRQASCYIRNEAMLH